MIIDDRSFEISRKEFLKILRRYAKESGRRIPINAEFRINGNLALGNTIGRIEFYWIKKHRRK